MVGDFDIFVAIDFEEVTSLSVNDETTDPECMVVFYIEEFFWISVVMD